MTRRWRWILAWIILTPVSGTTANAETTCYTDRGVEVCFPAGDVSFADEVVSFVMGDPPTIPASDDPLTILGPPNYDISQESNPDLDQEYITLGCGGTITVRFVDNALVDIDGPDLYVFEIGDHVEGTHLWISETGSNWIDVGEIEGATAIVDIAGVTPPDIEYSMVRLTDLKTHCDGKWPGADIDAVGAIGSVEVEVPEATGPAIVSVTVADASLGSARRAEIILDASNSMWGRVEDGRPKIEVAQQVLRDVLNTLPEDMAVGLRVYGHRISRERKQESCLDSELLAPIAPGNRAAILAALEGITPRGQTPIGYSLDALQEDLGNADGPTLIVLISDGIESCASEPDDPLYPPSVVEKLNRAGVSFRAHILGFDITDSTTRQFLVDLADDAGGTYLDAGDTDALRESVLGALSATFELIAEDGSVAASGIVGGPPVEVEAGIYALRVDTVTTVRLDAVEFEAETGVTFELARGDDGLEISIAD